MCVNILIFTFTSIAADHIASQDYMEINARDRNTLYGVTNGKTLNSTSLIQCNKIRDFWNNHITDNTNTFSQLTNFNKICWILEQYYL